MFQMVVVASGVNLVVNWIILIYLIKSISKVNSKMLKGVDSLIDKKTELNNYKLKK